MISFPEHKILVILVIPLSSIKGNPFHPSTPSSDVDFPYPFFQSDFGKLDEQLSVRMLQLPEFLVQNLFDR